MITRDTVVVKVPPRISAAKFEEVLKTAKSPAATEAREIYRVIVENGVDPAFMLAVFKHESQYSTDPKSMVVLHGTKNLGNTRSSRVGVKTIAPTERGNFVSYGTWTQGADDATYRLIDPEFEYARAGATTIGQIIPIWAPGSDGNDPAGYINTVISLMNQWTGSSTEVAPKMALKIALSAGHHNSDGGSPVEAAITGPLCHFYAMAFRELGCDVRVITPNDGLGQFPGGLQDVAAKVVEWASAGWVADLYLETHTQGLGDTTVRGAFAIYPDWGSDLDLAVKNGLGLKMVKAISAATGIPVWSSGIMSEKSTGVGISGYRLGIFLRTAPVADSTTRLIIEHGSHSNPLDLAILQSPEMQQKIANAGAKAAVDYLGGIHGPRPVDDPCMDYFNAHGGEPVFGKPLGGQYGTNGSIERDFQYCHMYYDKVNKEVIAEMKDRVNPKGLSVGPGVYSVLLSEGMTALTNEDYYVPDGNKPGLTKRSFTYAGKGGVTYRVEAIQDQDANNKPLPTWTRQIWQFIKEIK
jgi:hypothetical protein